MPKPVITSTNAIPIVVNRIAIQPSSPNTTSETLIGVAMTAS